MNRGTPMEGRCGVRDEGESRKGEKGVNEEKEEGQEALPNP